MWDQGKERDEVYKQEGGQSKKKWGRTITSGEPESLSQEFGIKIRSQLANLFIAETERHIKMQSCHFSSRDGK